MKYRPVCQGAVYGNNYIFMNCLYHKAKIKGIEVNDMVNDLLRKDIALIEGLK